MWKEGAAGHTGRSIDQSMRRFDQDQGIGRLIGLWENQSRDRFVQETHRLWGGKVDAHVPKGGSRPARVCVCLCQIPGTCRDPQAERGLIVNVSTLLGLHQHNTEISLRGTGIYR